MAAAERMSLSAAGFQDATAVSRETLARLAIYLALLEKWQPRINLVGSATLRDPWRRHFLDSAQLRPLLLESTQTVVDLGSGAGFPGLVLAILGLPDVHLIESDHRKIAFLREVAAATETKITVHPCRIEAVPRFSADAVTARALAPLAPLIGYALPFLGPRGVCLFLKGGQVERELAECPPGMTVERFESRSDPSGVVLRLSAFSPT
ncbi:MAG: 16S rRNA (guanine(527)-N(7))-methyltransferase RsmG [Rhodospirillaceae bacterium]